MKNESNEIDLLELLAKIYFLFKRNKYIILTFVLLGIIVGLYKSFQSDPYFQTKMLIKTSLENEMVQGQLQTLSELKENGNNNILAQELGITKEEAEEIKTFSVEEVEESSLLRINLEVFDNELITKIKEGIINYSETNEYIQQELKNKQDHYTQYLKEISDALELLRKEEKRQISAQSSMEIILSGDSYANQITKLMDKKENIETKKNQIQKPLIIVKDFYKPDKPKVATSLKIILHAVVGLFLGIIAVFGVFLIKKLEKYQKQ